MIPYLIAGLVGALVSNRGKPTSSVKKRQIIGARSGLDYEVDDLTESGIIIVHGPGAVGAFQRKDDGPGYKWLKGSGDRHVLAAMIGDLT
jgi:hypothetical protein